MAGGTIKCENVTGQCVSYDSKGQRTGTVDPDPAGGWVVRDTKGRRVGTIEAEQPDIRPDGPTLKEIIDREHRDEGLVH